MSNHNPAASADRKGIAMLTAKAGEWRLRIIRHPFSALIRLLTILCIAITVFLFFSGRRQHPRAGHSQPDLGFVLRSFHHG